MVLPTKRTTIIVKFNHILYNTWQLTTFTYHRLRLKSIKYKSPTHLILHQQSYIINIMIIHMKIISSNPYRQILIRSNYITIMNSSRYQWNQLDSNYNCRDTNLNWEIPIRLKLYKQLHKPHDRKEIGATISKNAA